MLVIVLNLGNFEYVDFSLCLIYVLGVSPPRPPPPPPPMTNPPHSKPTFWVSMGMNSQPPIPPCPAYPRLLLSPWILQLAYYYILWSPGATRGHPPHCGEIQPAYDRHGDPYPHPRLPPTPAMRPAPQPRWPSLSAKLHRLLLCPITPPPPRYSNPAFPYFLYFIPHILTLYPLLLPPPPPSHATIHVVRFV